VAVAALNKNKTMMKILTGWIAVLLTAPVIAANPNAATEAEAAYTRTITERADKIVATLNLADTNKYVRVRDLITRQYRDLSKIHDARDAAIKRAQEKTEADKAATESAVQAVRDENKSQTDKLHGEFLARLATELNPEQVDQVKDGLTYGVLPLTYGVYLKMYPELTEEQKAQIKAWLLEARELAMDGGTAREKHAVFGKYKGRINNYLSRAGYDAKQAEQNLRNAEAKTSNPASK
jgi:Spy/CpxP family protein refolding chaperone